MSAAFAMVKGVSLMTKNITIWERQFDLQVIFDCFDNEEVLPIQEQALEAFLKAENTIQESKQQLEKYILNDEYAEIEGNSIDNIFKYVIPTDLYIPRTPETRTVALLCDYRFDEEHGIAIVFENEQFKEIGEQDIVL